MSDIDMTLFSGFIIGIALYLILFISMGVHWVGYLILVLGLLSGIITYKNAKDVYKESGGVE